VNNLDMYGRWAFAEFGDVYQMEADFEAKVEAEFDKMIQKGIQDHGESDNHQATQSLES